MNHIPTDIKAALVVLVNRFGDEISEHALGAPNVVGQAIQILADHFGFDTGKDEIQREYLGWSEHQEMLRERYE